MQSKIGLATGWHKALFRQEKAAVLTLRDQCVFRSCAVLKAGSVASRVLRILVLRRQGSVLITCRGTQPQRDRDKKQDLAMATSHAARSDLVALAPSSPQNLCLDAAHVEEWQVLPGGKHRATC